MLFVYQRAKQWISRSRSNDLDILLTPNGVPRDPRRRRTIHATIGVLTCLLAPGH